MEKNFELIQKFFENLKCSQCDNFFAKEAVEPVRKEENNIVVRITCSYCGKNLGLAILGIDSNEYRNSLKLRSETENPKDTELGDEPINYDDVVAAHKFFSGLGEDWMKYIPKNDDK